MSSRSMLTVDYVRYVYDYGYWARDRILTQVSQLDRGAYVANAKLDYGSIRGTLVHILEREATWLARWEGRPDQLLGEQELPTFELCVRPGPEKRRRCEPSCSARRIACSSRLWNMSRPLAAGDTLFPCGR